jgi:hypothetical protein
LTAILSFADTYFLARRVDPRLIYPEAGVSPLTCLETIYSNRSVFLLLLLAEKQKGWGIMGVGTSN